MVATDPEWSAYSASGPAPREVLDEFESPGTGVAPSPECGIVGHAIKLGGKPLAEAFALLFAVAMRRGRVPVAWSTGFIKWLLKGKGDVLDPGAYHGVVLTSLVGKAFGRVRLKRLLRWLGAKSALPSLQTVPAGSTTSHLALINEILALQHGRRAAMYVMTVGTVKAYPPTSRLLLWRRLRELGLRGALLRLSTALFENAAHAGFAGGRYSGVIKRQTGVPEGFVLGPLLFAIAFSPVIDTLWATGASVRASGIWAGFFLLMDDVTPIADSYYDLKALAVALWEWYWRFRLEPYPGRPKTFVAVLGPGSKQEARAHGGVFSFEMSAQRAAQHVTGGAGAALPGDIAAVITIPIDDDIRVLGVRFSRLGGWTGFV